MHKNKKHTNTAPVLPPTCFPAFLFLSSLFLCLLSSLKIISLFLSVSPSSYYSLPQSSRLPFSCLHRTPPPRSFVAFLSFQSSSSISPPLLSSFLFLLMQHSSHSFRLLKGKDPAGRPRPNIITVLSASLSFFSHPVSPLLSLLLRLTSSFSVLILLRHSIVLTLSIFIHSCIFSLHKPSKQLIQFHR